MAKKTKKQKQRAAPRRPAATTATSGRPAATADTRTSASSTPATAGATGELPAAQPAAAVGPGARRRVERVDAAVARPQPRGRQPRSRYAGTSAGMMAPLDAEDPAIPFDRVPYVPADLRRVGIIAAVMIVIIIVAGLIVSNLVT